MASKPKPKTKQVPDGLMGKMHNWDALIETFKTATENELWDLLKYETKHRKRLSFAIRIHGVANQKRYDRERKEVMAALSK